MQAEYEKMIDHNLDTSTLMIKTDGSIRAGHLLVVWFYRRDTNNGPSGIHIDTNSNKYKILKCRHSLERFNTDLPTENIKIWKITKTPEPRLIIDCNDKEMLNVQLSETVCTSEKKWRNYWGWGEGLQERIQFKSNRGKTYFYMSKELNIITVEQCTGFKASWTNIQLAETDFPVNKDTTVTLKCHDGFQISGDTTVTCLKDTEFTFGIEPSCSKLFL